MHTEDDTFARLIKTPFNEIRVAVGTARLKKMAGTTTEPVESILNRHGWKEDEYNAEMAKVYEAYFTDMTIKVYDSGDFELYRNIGDSFELFKK